MRTFLKFLVAIFLGAAGSPAQAANTQARLVLDSETARPGDTIMAGIHLHMNAGWHIYWKNPGIGIPTEIKWDLAAGITAGEIQWPPPQKDSDFDEITYAYHDDVVLLVPLTLANDLKPGPLELKAEVSWLECKGSCIQAGDKVQATLKIGAEKKPSLEAGLIESWQKKLPKSAGGLGARAQWEKPANDNLRPVILEWSSPNAASEADFFPDAGGGLNTERIPADARKIRLRVQVRKSEGGWPKQISGLLIQKSGAERLAFAVALPIESSANAPAQVNSGASLPQSLWQMLLYAFLGGLILNVMPCVLPVIALKILGFVAQARDQPHRVRRLGLLYTLGVLVSFLGLAGLVIGFKAGGHNVGWGMQFGSPQFIVALTVLVTLVALNLFGVFEIILSGRAMDAAGTLASKQGSAGAFFNGVLATALATPCTAPFLGIALGFAFVQPSAIVVLMFLAVGFGLAFPYLILSWEPSWLKFLPKPGAWMEKFKIAMGFPMLATAVWLFSLTPSYYGKRALWLGIFLVIVALAAWIYGEFVQRGRTRRGLALGIMLILLVGGYWSVIENRLHWREMVEERNGQGWSPRAVAQARADGHPVIVDFTADWCLTCNIIVKPALEMDSVRKKMEELNARLFVADYSRTPPAMTEEIARHGRAGVPLVLVYSKNPDEPPIVLPEPDPPPFGTPTKYSRIILDALDRAAR